MQFFFGRDMHFFFGRESRRSTHCPTRAYAASHVGARGKKAVLPTVNCFPVHSYMCTVNSRHCMMHPTTWHAFGNEAEMRTITVDGVPFKPMYIQQKHVYEVLED